MRSLGSRSAFPHALFALLTVFLTVAHLFTSSEFSTLIAMEAVLPLALAVGIAYAGYRFRDLAPTRDQMLRAGGIMLAGGLYGGGFVAFIGQLQRLNGATFVQVEYMTLVAGAGGVAMSSVIAHFYVAFEARVADLDAQYRRADHLRKQVSVLDRVLRHNLRNDVVAIRGYVDRLVRDDGLDADEAHERIRDRLADIEETGEYARRIQGVLRTEETAAFDLVEVVESAVAALEATPGVSVSTDLPATAAVVARPALDDAVAEALGNALEHNDPVGLTVRVTVDRPADWHGWRLRVADDGLGVPEAEIEALHSDEEGALTHGQGLGLFFMQTVVRESGGRLDLAQNDDGGTTVEMYLPPAPAETD